MSCHLLLNLLHELHNIIFANECNKFSNKWQRIWYFIYYITENYRNIDFSVINKDRGNWVKVVIRSNSKTQRRQNIVPNKRNI